MCNPEPTTLAEYCRESVAASVLNNYQEQVMLPGATEKQAAEMAPMYDNEVKFKWSEAEYQARKAAKEWSESTTGEYELQTVETSAQVQTKSILAEADEIAGTNRSRDYGHPLANHRRIAEIWNVQLEKKLAVPLTPGDVATLMIGLKLARLVNSPNHRDSFIDICGYAKCWDMIQEAGGE